ncbi:MAG: SAM-dependent methyltransferase [Betaproteobacteria bacterium]|nr:SAM-dependent methyltransferase [Betaproteobacteria bacterium]
MTSKPDGMQNVGHTGIDAPSTWVERFAGRIEPGGRILDVACGHGRHARWLAARGHPVEAVDRDADALNDLIDVAGVVTLAADLEGGPWPYADQRFAGIVVVNYLHRPLFPALIASLAPGGVLIYETFALGNERYGRPRNPDFLLQPGELLQRAHGRLEVIAYEHLTIEAPRPAVVQRMCALNGAPPFSA